MSAPVITEGVYDMPDAVYHSIKDRLSCSGAKKLLPPSCPAIYRYELDNPPETKPHFDFGHAAHQKLLGAGAKLRVIAADDWKSAKAQQARKEAHAAGEIPLLTKELEVVDAMVAKVREHPIASALLNPDYGNPERSLFWDDPRTGVPLRGRLDWLPVPQPGRRLLVADYKTAVSSAPASFSKSAADYAYMMQDSFYLDAVRALEIDDNPAFLFVVQMKTPPFLVTVIELDEDAKRIGRGLNNRAIDTYIDCMTTGNWPGFSDEVELVSLPKWFTYQHEDLL